MTAAWIDMVDPAIEHYSVDGIDLVGFEHLVNRRSPIWYTARS
jgi:hypothetical protein